MRTRLSNRTAMSLLELLVVIFIIQVLIALLLVGVQAAREAARRTSCANNLRQLGVGLQSYHAALGQLPPAVVWAGVGEPLGEGSLPIGIIDRVVRFGDAQLDTIHANWVALLLPYLGESALAAAFDWSLPVAADKNRVARATKLPTMCCPSDRFNGPENLFERGRGAGLLGNTYARGNYAINVGPDRACLEIPQSPDDPPCVGGFFVRTADLLNTNDQVWGSGIAGANKSFGWANVTDGLSHTVAVDEIRAGVNRNDPRGVWALTRPR